VLQKTRQKLLPDVKQKMTAKINNPLIKSQYESGVNWIFKIKTQAQSRKTLFESGANAAEVLACGDNLNMMSSNLSPILSYPGINDYAKFFEQDINYDFIAESNVILVAINDVVAEVYSVVPTDVNGWATIIKVNFDLTRAHKDFTIAELASVVAKLDVILAAIE